MNKKQEFERLLRMSEPEIIKYLATEMYRIYGKDNVETDFNNYIVAQGTNPICLVAHVDTVGVGLTGELLVWSNNVLRVGGTKGGILGADDRAGVFGIIDALYMARKFNLEMPSVIFTNYEESGGVGVKTLIKDNAFDISNTTLFIELDRKGSNEYVYYTADIPREVKDYVESFGYVQNEGSYSDIQDLAWEYKIPAVNLSIGYYHQHTPSERLHWDEMKMNINRVFEMLQSPLKTLYSLSDADCSYYSWGSKYQFLSRDYRDGGYVDVGSYTTATGYSEADWEAFYGYGSENNKSLLFDIEDVRADLYRYIQEDNFWEMYAEYNDNDIIISVLNDFFDMFNYELDKLGGWRRIDMLEPSEFDDLFAACWDIAASSYY